MFVTEMGVAHALSAIWVQESGRRKTPPDTLASHRTDARKCYELW